jgi:S-adenosyl methyltransferase
VAQAIAPETRVVYVDNDQVVIAYSRALLRNNAISPDAGAEDGSIVDLQLPVFDFEDGDADLDEDADADSGGDADEAEDAGEQSPRRGLIGHVLSDLCDPDRILQNAETRAVIDFTRPVGLLLVAVAHFCTDDATVYPAVAKLIEVLPSGSIVAFSHVAADYVDPRIVTRVDNAMSDHNSDFRWRRTFDCARFAWGLEFVEPGLVPIAQWRAEGEPEPRPTPAEVGICAWVARKP